MSTTQEVKNINFSIKTIELIGFNLQQPGKINPNQATFNFDIKSEIKLNNELELVLVVLVVDIYNHDKSVKHGDITTSCIFHVTEFNNYVDKKKNTLNFPEEFIITINSISISTTRGMMFSQFRGTFLHNAILPVIDPKALIPHKNK